MTSNYVTTTYFPAYNYKNKLNNRYVIIPMSLGDFNLKDY